MELITGKKIGSTIYFHTSAFENMASTTQAAITTAQKLLKDNNYNVIKINLDSQQVSF